MVFPHNADPAWLRAHAAMVFDAITSSHVRAHVAARLPLAEAAAAHRLAEGRGSAEAIVLVP